MENKNISPKLARNLLYQ